MLSARELSQVDLPDQAKTWQNLHLFYTHGYGICMSPSNLVTPEWSPEFFVKNIPPESVLGGDGQAGDLLRRGREGVRNREDEARGVRLSPGRRERLRRIPGAGGIELDPMMRLLFAYRLASSKILLSDDITSESRVMIRRSVLDRSGAVAPFLAFDQDPYPVFADGRLFWIVDAYTLTDGYPYSEPSGSSTTHNPVKVVIDAYNGTVLYHVAEEEPLVRAHREIFPELFQPISSMPEELRSHLRYPVDLFGVQARIYRDYHMKDPRSSTTGRTPGRSRWRSTRGRASPSSPTTSS